MAKLVSSLVPQDRGGALVGSKELIKRPGVEYVELVIDVSGSMETDFGGKSRLEAVVDAVYTIIDSSSRLMTNMGLIQLESGTERLVDVTDRFSSLKAAAMRMKVQGGTNYAPALKLALSSKPNRVILLSDGEATDKSYALDVVKQFKERNIRIDTVAVGETGVEFLCLISEMTGGIYTFCSDIQALQETFLKLETRQRQLEDKR